MYKISITEFRKSFNSYIERLQNGETFQLTKYGKKIGVISIHKSSKIDILNSFVGIAKDIDLENTRTKRIIGK